GQANSSTARGCSEDDSAIFGPPPVEASRAGRWMSIRYLRMAELSDCRTIFVGNLTSRIRWHTKTRTRRCQYSKRIAGSGLIHSSCENRWSSDIRIGDPQIFYWHTHDEIRLSS